MTSRLFFEEATQFDWAGGKISLGTDVGFDEVFLRSLNTNVGTGASTRPESGLLD
jgi:hypothetical protein